MVVGSTIIDKAVLHRFRIGHTQDGFIIAGAVERALDADLLYFGKGVRPTNDDAVATGIFHRKIRKGILLGGGLATDQAYHGHNKKSKK